MATRTGKRRKRFDLDDAEFRAKLDGIKSDLAERKLEKSERLLAKTPRDRESLLAEAERIEREELDSVHRVDDDFELYVPFDVMRERALKVIAVEHRFRHEGGYIRERHRAHLDLWSFSSEHPSHWLKDNDDLCRVAELRREAFGVREYPVHACHHCYRLTGWVSAEEEKVDLCDYCLWSLKMQELGRTAMYTSSGWRRRDDYLDLATYYDDAVEHEYKRVRRGPGRRPWLGWFGRRRRHEERRLQAWGKVLHDLAADWGPGRPEEGYTVWIPERFECEAQDGSTLLLHFWATRYRWDSNRWRRRGQKLKQERLQVPTVFEAILEPAALAHAWLDFRVAVQEVNRAEWEERLRREQVERARQERAESGRERIAEAKGAVAILEP